MNNKANSEFQKPYSKIGELTHELLFNKLLTDEQRKEIKKKINKLRGFKFYKDI